MKTIDADTFPLYGRSAPFWIALRGVLAALNVKTADAAQAEEELRAVATMDDVLEGNPPAKRISRGTVWTAESVQPIRDSLVDALTALEAHKNFALGSPLEAEEVGKVIDLAKTWVARAEDALHRAKDAQQAGGTGFTPHTERAEAERSDGPLSTAMYPGSHDHDPAGDRPVVDHALTSRGSSLFASARKHTQDYAAGLKKGRETTAPTAPARVRTAADYAANLAAGRAAKRGS